MMHNRNNSLSRYEKWKRVLKTDEKTEEVPVRNRELRKENAKKRNGNDEKRYRMVSDENSIYEYDLKCISEKNNGL